MRNRHAYRARERVDEPMNSLISGRRILVVEDEMIVAGLLEDMLIELGYAVVGPASRVNQALALLDTETIDAAVLDVNLNGQKSYPIAVVLMARHVPFCFSTGYHKDSLADGYKGLPALQKPFERFRLAETLAKLLTPTQPNV